MEKLELYIVGRNELNLRHKEYVYLLLYYTSQIIEDM